MSSDPPIQECPAQVTPIGVSSDACFGRGKRKSTVAEERRHLRRLWTARLTLWVMDRTDPWETPRSLTVQTRDLSRGGFSFLHQHYFHNKTLISTQFDSLPNRPVVIGEVVSCVYVGNHQHRVGVRFLEASPETQAPFDRR